jgi:membrane protein required for beta-lactamase induction
MNLETLLTYALRLWLAGMLHLGLFLIQAGPFGLAGLGFVGWRVSVRPRTQRQGREVAVDSALFTLR